MNHLNKILHSKLLYAPDKLRGLLIFLCVFFLFGSAFRCDDLAFALGTNGGHSISVNKSPFLAILDAASNIAGNNLKLQSVSGALKETGAIFETFDVVVVGAGLSGLSAAFELKDMHVLVLEKQMDAGGRVATRSHGGVSYDMGAIFGMGGNIFRAFGASVPDIIEETAPVGLFYKGKMYFEDNAMTCMESVGPLIKAGARAAFEEASRGVSPDFEKLGRECKNLINAFFQVIHPGEINEYIPERQLDAYRRFDTSHYACGNRVIIDALISALKPKKCDIRTNANVLSVDDAGDKAAVTFSWNGREYKAFSKAVIVATTPAPALKILKKINARTLEFLKSVVYKGGTVVALGVQNAKKPDFSYIVAPDSPVNTVIKQNTAKPGVEVLFAYYTGTREAKIASLSDDQAVKETVSALCKMGICDEKKVIFSDIMRWKEIGPVIKTGTYGGWDNGLTKPSPRVFLAGEYVFFEKNNPMPYGMAAAMRSGAVRAGAVREFLKSFESAADTVENFLVDAFIYEFSDTMPVFQKRVEEGNVAFYGTILQAARDKKIQDYLMACRCNGLWEYQVGFGVTPEDSAVVMEGLLEAGADEKMLLECVKLLIARYFDTKAGAFKTVPDNLGRSAYWRGPSIDATAHIGYLMTRIGPDEFKNEIRSCADYLLKTQLEEGQWRGKWFQSQYITTLYAIRLLSAVEPREAGPLKKAEEYILSRQKADGSFDGSVINSSAALLGLTAINGSKAPDYTPGPEVKEGIRKCRKWLLDNDAVKGRYGEPILYYWYDDVKRGGEKQKRFYHCVDKGRIGGAWARIALDVSR